MSSTPEVDAVVVGAGIAGLAAALELQATGHEVTVIDPSDRPGGVMRTDHAGGYVVERGPNTTQVKAPMRAFLEQRGLDEALLRAQPASRLRFVLRGSGVMRIGDEELELRPGRYVRVEPGVVRQPVAGPDGLAWIALGAVSGGGYAPRGPF